MSQTENPDPATLNPAGEILPDPDPGFADPTIDPAICSGSHRNGYWLDSNPADHFFDPALCRGIEPIVQGKTFADFGCGLGEYTESLREAAAGFIGVDGDPTFIQRLATAIRPNYRQADLTEPLWLGRCFDWIICLEVGHCIPAELTPNLIENIDRHAKEGIILSWDFEKSASRGCVNPIPRAELEAKFFGIGYQTADDLRENLLDEAPEWEENLTVLIRNQGTARFRALFIGGPLHRQTKDLTHYPLTFIHTTEPDETIKHGLWPGNQNHRYRLHENLTDRGSNVLTTVQDRFAVTYFYEG